MEDQQKRKIVIVGGGIIGCTTAYYLTRHPKFDPAKHSILLLEATEIAAGASGKAGGLLALWAYPKYIVPLSYRLHEQLAIEHNGAERWGYRRLGCGTIHGTVKTSDIEARALLKSNNGNESSRDNGAPLSIQSTQKDNSKDWEKLPKQDDAATQLLKGSALPPDLNWIDGNIVQTWQEMGQPDETETAQVHPLHFTTSIAELAREKGVDIRTGAKVLKINHSKTDVRNVEYEDRATGQVNVIDDVTDVVVAAGPWTGRIVPRTKIESLRAHSVVFEADVTPYAVFTELALPNDYVPEHRAKKGQRRKHKGNVDPEVYARPFGEVYACGEPDNTVALPETADLVQRDEDQCDDLIAYLGTISPALHNAHIKARQACYLPRHMRFGSEYNPLIGPTSINGLWIASGHTCWGIQNGPATGYLMAEWMMDGEAKSADIESMDPRKFKV